MAGGRDLSKLSPFDAAPGPRDHSRRPDNRAAAASDSLRVGVCAEAGVSESFLDLRRRGIVSEAEGHPAEDALGGYLSVEDHPAAAAAELCGLTSPGKIFRYPGDGRRVGQIDVAVEELSQRQKGPPAEDVPGYYPSVKDRPAVAAAELERLTSLAARPA